MAPNTCMARSAMRCSIAGTETLISDTSRQAPWWPARSSTHAHPSQRAHQPHAFFVHRNDDAGMAAGTGGLGMAYSHHDQETAMRMRGASDEPFSAANDVLIALSDDGGCDVGRVG